MFVAFPGNETWQAIYSLFARLTPCRACSYSLEPAGHFLSSGRPGHHGPGPRAQRQSRHRRLDRLPRRTQAGAAHRAAGASAGAGAGAVRGRGADVRRLVRGGHVRVRRRGSGRRAGGTRGVAEMERQRAAAEAAARGSQGTLCVDYTGWELYTDQGTGLTWAMLH